MAVAFLFLTALFKHISYPLIWHDESDTVMFAQRVLEYGYPKVHGPKNIVYGLEGPDLLVDPRTDAYTGAPWSAYYFGSIGVALARGVDDLYGKTALLRIPFAVIGALGMFLFLISVLDSVGSKASRRILFSIQYWALATYSVSLLLHLREARYYSLIIFLSAALLLVFVRHHIYGRMAFGRYCGCVTLLLFLIFNTFYPAYPVFLVVIGIHHLWEAFFVKESGRVRWRWLLRSSSPLLLSLFTTLPLLLYFDFLGQTQGWLGDAAIRAYVSSLSVTLANLLRFEFLVPALAIRLGLLLQRGFRKTEAHSASTREPRAQISRFLWLFIVIYWLIVSRSPFIWERYFIVLSPILIVVVLLDAWTFRDRIGEPRHRWVTPTTAAAVTIVFAASCWLRIPEFRGRMYEITHPFKGPLDFVIPYLQQNYSNPEELVIATNYEDPAYMYYLGSHVIVGYYGANLAADIELYPDIIVPRPWANQRDSLRKLAERGEYEIKSFPVKSLMANNIPGLSPVNPGGLVHHFFAPRVSRKEEVQLILERVSRDQ